MLWGNCTLLVVSRPLQNAELGDNCKDFVPVPDHLSSSRHSAPRAIATPCVKVCAVDGGSGLCLGCYRTLAEIGGWSGYSDEERSRIMAELPSRRSRIDPRLLAPEG